MGRKVGRTARPTTTLKVGGRSDNEARRLGELARDDGGIGQRTETQGDVDPVDNQILPLIVDVISTRSAG